MKTLKTLLADVDMCFAANTSKTCKRNKKC